MDDDKSVTTQQQQIVQFTSEGVIPTTVTLPDTTNLSPGYLSMTTKEERDHNIKDFLSRPIIIKTDKWLSTQINETQLYTANFPEELIANPMYQDKLRGFVGLRATLIIKVQVNSQPFQQGRLLLQYFPYAQYMPNRVTLVNSTLQGRTGCPRSDLDLSSGTEMIMRIPYVSPHAFYNLITGQGSFGAIYLVVYSQLRDQLTGTGAIEYTIWAHLEDIELEYPTGANIFTGTAPNFMSEGARMLSGRYTQSDFQKAWHSKAYLKKPSRIFAQTGVELKQLALAHAPSTGLGQISSGLKTLSTIPVVGNLFTKPAWISSQASNIFRILGFSKPTVAGLPCESKLRTQTRMANYDGADVSHKLALSSQNEIETVKGLAGTATDEMALSSVLSIPNYWDRFSWTTSQNTNTVLFDNYVTPMKIKPYSSTILDRFRCTHMGYVANSHGLWRGSIVYTFKVVKTQFHSGRLRISFIPFYFNSTISSGDADVSRTQKIILDLRTASEVSFTVPYVSSRPWMFCMRPESALLGAEGVSMYNAVTGIVRVEVLNQLVAANNVFQEVDVICEVNGGPDLTFANPTCPSYVPYGGTFTAEATKKRDKEKEEEYTNATVQMMSENESIPRNEAQKGNHPMSIDTHQISANWSPEAYCIGEKVMSIRQLIKRFGILEGGGLTLDDAATRNGIILAPFSQKAPTTTVPASRSMSQFDYYYYLYAFWRGSMRIKLISEVADPTTTPPTARKASRFTWTLNMYTSLQDAVKVISDLFAGKSDCVDTALIPFVATTSNPSTLVVDPTIEGAVEFEVPYYNVSHISPATLFTSTNSPAGVPDMLKGHIPPVLLSLQPRTNPATGNSITTRFYRAPGDDFSFMYLVGVPPLVNQGWP
nr:MAG: putative capsid protein [Dicistroviridae sp.]